VNGHGSRRFAWCSLWLVAVLPWLAPHAVHAAVIETLRVSGRITSGDPSPEARPFVGARIAATILYDRDTPPQAITGSSALYYGAVKALDVTLGDVRWSLNLHELKVIDGSPEDFVLLRSLAPPEPLYDQWRLFTLAYYFASSGDPLSSTSVPSLRLLAREHPGTSSVSLYFINIFDPNSYVELLAPVTTPAPSGVTLLAGALAGLLWAAKGVRRRSRPSTAPAGAQSPWSRDRDGDLVGAAGR
jgi:hypothetical protein